MEKVKASLSIQGYLSIPSGLLLSPFTMISAAFKFLSPNHLNLWLSSSTPSFFQCAPHSLPAPFLCSFVEWDFVEFVDFSAEAKKCLLFVTFLHFHIFCIIPYSGLWSIHSTNSCLCRHCCPKRCVCFMRNFLWICHHESPLDSFLKTFSSSRLNFKQYFFKQKNSYFSFKPLHPKHVVPSYSITP